MALLPNNPLITIAQGNQTPIGAPPVAAGPTGFQQFSQGLLGNPLFGLGAGLLAGAAPGGTFAGGLNIGLQNMLQMQRQQQATALMGARLAEMRADRREKDRIARARENLYSSLDQDQRRWYEAGLEPPTPEAPMSAIGKLQADRAAGRIDEDQYTTALSRMGAPTTVVNVAGEQTGPRIWTPEEVAASGLQPGTVVTQEPGKTPKILQSSEKRQADFAKLDQVGDAVSTYRNVLERTGTEFMPTENKLELAAAYNNLMLEAKELYNLGVLQGPDLEIMNSVMKDPTTFTSQFYSNEALENQLKVFENKLEEARNRLNQQYGVEDSTSGPIIRFEDLP